MISIFLTSSVCVLWLIAPPVGWISRTDAHSASCPSGQRELTVNQPSSTSQVRILYLPPADEGPGSLIRGLRRMRSAAFVPQTRKRPASPEGESAGRFLQKSSAGEAGRLRCCRVAEVHVGLDLRVPGRTGLVELLGRALALDLEALGSRSVFVGGGGAVVLGSGSGLLDRGLLGGSLLNGSLLDRGLLSGGLGCGRGPSRPSAQPWSSASRARARAR